MRLALWRGCGLWEVGRSGVWDPQFMTPRGAGHPWAVLVPAGAGRGVHGPATEGRTFCKCAEGQGGLRCCRCTWGSPDGEGPQPERVSRTHPGQQEALATTGRAASAPLLTLSNRLPGEVFHIWLVNGGWPAALLLPVPKDLLGHNSKPFTGRRARGDCRMPEGGNSLAGSGILGSNGPTALYSTGNWLSVEGRLGYTSG